MNCRRAEDQILEQGTETQTVNTHNRARTYIEIIKKLKTQKFVAGRRARWLDVLQGVLSCSRQSHRCHQMWGNIPAVGCSASLVATSNLCSHTHTHTQLATQQKSRSLGAVNKTVAATRVQLLTTSPTERVVFRKLD